VSEERFENLKEEYPGYDVEQGEQDAEKVARESIEESIGASEARTAIGRVSNPVSKITDVSADVDARFIVIGGRKRTPVGKAVFGSVTQSVLLQADRPVVCVMGE
ncbi:MAG: universal stress protein, partial [Salinigranum sp.]